MMKIDTEMTRDQLEMVSGNGFWGDVGLGSAVGIGVAGAALGGVVGGVLSETLPEGS